MNTGRDVVSSVVDLDVGWIKYQQIIPLKPLVS